MNKQIWPASISICYLRVKGISRKYVRIWKIKVWKCVWYTSAIRPNANVLLEYQVESPGGLNLHVSPSSAVLHWRCRRSNWLVSFVISPTAPTKFVPLSLITSLGTLWRLVKRAKAFKNVSVSSPQAISKCAVRVSRQVKRHSHLFCRVFRVPEECTKDQQNLRLFGRRVWSWNGVSFSGVAP